MCQAGFLPGDYEKWMSEGGGGIRWINERGKRERRGGGGDQEGDGVEEKGSDELLQLEEGHQ